MTGGLSKVVPSGYLQRVRRSRITVCATFISGLWADTVTGFTATIATQGNIGCRLFTVELMSSYAHLDVQREQDTSDAGYVDWPV